MNKNITPSCPFQNRSAGILLHPTSLPGPYGIGDLGQYAYHWIDFLKASGQSLWQILPLGPTGFGDSPYQSFSSFAGQPLIIDPEEFLSLGLLTKEDLKPESPLDPDAVDYGKAISFKTLLYKKAYKQFAACKSTSIYQQFCSFRKAEAEWLDDYSLFMACKDYHNGRSWIEWKDEMTNPNEELKKELHQRLSYECDYYRFLQFFFYRQWTALKNYAHQNGIQIIGDLPIFVSIDSADVWSAKHLFQLDSKGIPTAVAGVPPDYFSETGQLWGNPLYRWKEHAKDNYSWWIKRVKAQLRLVDFIRIDHFRGFCSYWSIPYGEETAIHGEWKKGPGSRFFKALSSAFATPLPIIAEDLGIITEDVTALRLKFNLPGMKVLQFAFDNPEDNDLLPHHHERSYVCYTGTHDNDTTLGWYQTLSAFAKAKADAYLNISNRLPVNWAFINACFGSVANTAIIPLQDLLGLGSDGRMNRPGTASDNWTYRYEEGQLTKALANQLLTVTELYGRKR